MIELLVACAICKKPVKVDEAIFINKLIGDRIEPVYAFCSKECYEEW